MCRKIYTSLFYISIFLGHLLISPLMAGQSNEILGLEEALSLAYQKNPRIIQARRAIEGSQGELITARTWTNPEVEAEIGGLKKDDEGRRKGHLDSITFKQNFDPPGVRHLGTKIAKNDVLIQEENLKAIWGEIYVQTRDTYSKIILDKKELELKQSNLKAMRQFFSNVQIRYQSGKILKNHLQRAKIELLNAESDYIKAENEIEISKSKLNLLLGRPRQTIFVIKEDLREEKLILNLEKLTQIALERRPDLKIEALELDSKIKSVSKEQLSRLPSYSLGFQKVNEEYEKDYAAIIEVSIPLWNLNQGEVKKAKAKLYAQQAQMEASKSEVEFTVYSLYQKSKLALKQLNLFKQSLEEANEMFRLAGLSYREGEIGFVDYLDQVQTSLNSRIQYYQGLYTLNQTVNALEQAVYQSVRQEEFLR